MKTRIGHTVSIGQRIGVDQPTDRSKALEIKGKYPDRAARMAFPGKFRGRVHLDACRTGFMICPGLGPDYGRPYYDDRWGVETDWIDGKSAWFLFKAGAAGDLPVIEALLDEDPRLVNALHWYTQPVHMAARHGHADAVQLLLDRGADPGLNIFGPTWASLLEGARERGFVDVIEVLENAMNARFGYDPAFGEIADLIKTGGSERVVCERVASVLRARPELTGRADEDGNNGLHLGVLNGRKNLIELFLDRGVPIDSRRADGKTPLTLSFDVGYGLDPPDPKLGLTEFLLEKGAHYAITAACHLGDFDRVASILGAHPADKHRDAALRSPLSYAVRAGHQRIVRLLLEAGIDGHLVDEALFVAVWHKQTDLVHLLLESSANPNVELDSCGCAAGTDDQTIRDLLIRHGAVYPPSWSLDREALRTMVDDKFKRVRDPYVAAEVIGSEDERLIDTLLADNPETPGRLVDLQYLPGWGDNAAITRKLVAAGLDPNRRTFDGQTYLHVCARHGWTSTARSLIEHGARVNVLDEKDGQTPLAVAVKNGRIEMVRLLQKYGADSGLADWPWTRPLAIAAEKGEDEIMELIREWRD